MSTQEQSTVSDCGEELKLKLWGAVWCDGENKKMFYITKDNGAVIILTKGSWITLPGRDDKVIIDEIYSLNDEDIGPVGISYLPWRYTEKRFAQLLCGLKGNQRFIVCYPAGRNKYGMHINWSNVYLCEKPDNIEQDQIDALFYKKKGIDN